MFVATDVYTFHVTYQGLEEKIWRDIAVSSNYRLEQLGYAVLAAFDTMAYHLFRFSYRGGEFVLPSDEFDEECEIDVGFFQLRQMEMYLGCKLEMTYDYGTEQVFILELTAIKPMVKGQGMRYPKITNGAGYGIIDDMHWTELKELIDQIDRNGKTDTPVYYQESLKPWDYRDFDMNCWERIFKSLVRNVEDAYAPFWE